jgi:phosphatidylinositol-3-phosphatase
MTCRGKSRAGRPGVVRQAFHRAGVANAVEPLEARELLSGTTSAGGPIVTPAHVVIVIEEDRYANAIGDTADMPYLNQLAGTGLVYSNSHGLNTAAQEGEMSYLGLFSGSTQGVTDNAYHGPFAGGNLAQSLNNKAGLSFASFAEAMPHAGDTTDNYAAMPGNPAYDDLYVRAYNPASQFTNVGTGKTNAQVNQTFATFPTTAAGYASLPTVSFVIPDTLHNTHGSNDTDPYATDPTQYNYLRQNADTWLQQHLDGYLQWAKQNNSLLIITGDEGDRAHNFAAGFATIINGSSNLFVAGTDTKSVTPYNLLRTIEDMYAVAPLANSASAADYDTDTTGRLATGALTLASTTTTLSSNLNPAAEGQPVTFTATVSSGAGTPGGTVSFLEGATTLGTGTLNASGVATFTTSSLAIGTHHLTAAYGGNANFAASQSATLNQTVQVTVTSVVINGNNTALAGVQRSMVDSIVYTFSEPVTMSASGAFTIGVRAGQTGTAPTLNWAAISPDDNGAATRWVVTFSGNGVVGNSIANGVYDITLNASAAVPESDPTATVAPRPTDTFYRLFGDINGDRVVNVSDEFQFGQALNAYNPAFDYNADGTVNLADEFQASKSFSSGGLQGGFVTTI